MPDSNRKMSRHKKELCRLHDFVAKELMKAKREGDALSFNICLEHMKRRQQIFDGDRSHPEIVALDTISCWLRSNKKT
jgi:hypothetical protein